jgi:hypothetical protein
MTRRSSSSVLISLRKRSAPTLAGSGSIRTLASKHGVGRRPRVPLDWSCARRCWNKRSVGLRRGLQEHLRPRRRRRRSLDGVGRERRGGAMFSREALRLVWW